MKNVIEFPRFRAKTFKLKSGLLKTYYVWDGRSSGMKDIRLGDDRAEALKLWEKCQKSEFPVKVKVDRVKEKRHERLASKKVLRVGHRKTFSNAKKSVIWGDTPLWVKRMYYSAEARSLKKGRSFSLTPADIQLLLVRANGVCEITSIPFEPNGKKSPFCLSLDRIDCAKGYELSNVRLVCLAINIAMSTWGLAPLMKIVKALSGNENLVVAPNHDPIEAPMLLNV